MLPQCLLDGMNFMAQSVSELSLGPTKAVTSWLTDQIPPCLLEAQLPDPELQPVCHILQRQ